MTTDAGLQAMADDGRQDATRRDDGTRRDDATGGDEARARAARVRGRNLVLGAALVLLVLLIYAVSFVKVPGVPEPAPDDASAPAAQPLSGVRGE